MKATEGSKETGVDKKNTCNARVLKMILELVFKRKIECCLRHSKIARSADFSCPQQKSSSRSTIWEAASVTSLPLMTFHVFLLSLNYFVEKLSSQ